jgi:hypothetical protein
MLNILELISLYISGSFSSELHQVANVALLCEDTINGMISANHFSKTSVDASLGLFNGGNLSKINKTPLHIILDFDDCDWIYKIHAGNVAHHYDSIDNKLTDRKVHFNEFS